MELEIDIGEMDGSIFEEEIAELEKELTTETDEEKTEPEPVREESVTETDPKSEKSKSRRDLIRLFWNLNFCQA